MSVKDDVLISLDHSSKSEAKRKLVTALMFPQPKIAYKGKPTYNRKNLPIQHLIVTIYKTNCQSLINLRSIDKSSMEKYYLQHDSIILYDQRNDMIVIKTKADMEKRQTEFQFVKPIFSVTKKGGNNGSSQFILQGFTLHNLFDKVSPILYMSAPTQGESFSVIKKGSKLYMGNILMKILELKSLSQFRHEQNLLICEENQQQVPSQDQLIQMCFCRSKFLPNNLQKSAKFSQIYKFVEANHTPQLLNTPCICGICISTSISKDSLHKVLPNLLSLDEPEGKFIFIFTLQRLSSKRTTKDNRLYLVGLSDQNEIKIGRDITNNIQIDQLSVSRYHSKLVFDQEMNSFGMIDMKSTYGTLTKVEDTQQTIIQDKQTLLFQRRIIEFQIPVS